MVSTALLILAPVLIGVIIFGTTILLSSSKKPNVNDTDLGNITTTAQLIATVLIPDKVATTVSLVFTTSPVIVTLPPIVHPVTTTDTDPPATTTKDLTQKPVKEGAPPSPSPSKAKSETTTTEKAAVVTTLSLKPTPSTTTTIESPTPTKSGITVFPGITIPNPLDLFKPAEPVEPPESTTTTTTAAVVSPTTTTTAKEVPTTTTTMAKELPTATNATTITTTAANPTPTRSEITIFPGITIPNPVDLFKPADPPKPINTTAEIDAITTTVAKEITKPTTTTTTTTATRATTSTTTTTTRLTLTKSGITIFPGINLPNPFDLFKPAEPPKSTNTAVAAAATTTTTVAKDVPGPTPTVTTTTAVAAAIAASPSPTKRPGFTLFLGTTLPDPLDLFPHGHPGGETGSLSHRLHPTKVDDITKGKEHVEIEDYDDIEDVRDGQSQDKADADEEWEDEDNPFHLLHLKTHRNQTKSFEEYLNLIVNKLIQSDEMEPYQDLLFESIAVSKLEIPENNDDDSTLDFDTDDQVDTLYSFRTSHPPSSDNNPVFQGPRAVSRVSIFTSILNTFLPPFILRFRADLRNFLFWICSPNSSVHIDGKDASGDGTWARKVTQDDIDKLIHPDGSIDLKSIWDPSVGPLALECIKSHAQVFWNEVSRLVGTRFTQIKEVFIDQLRGLSGWPQFSSSSVPAENAMIDLPDQQREEKEQQQQEEQVTKAKEQDTDTIADLDIAGEYTQMEEPEFSSFSAPAITVAQEKTSSSPIHPNQHRKQGKPSPASDQALNLRANQRIEATSDKADGFVKWFVDTVVNELQDGYFADAKAPAVSRVETQPSGSEDDGSREAGERICAWMKERVENVLQ
ncbi:hypothetical protein KI688_004528 [Linnemannia hyalina]|uniref:Uncharacterized protein n=1 Tax=Linnemannia hyalina TaxID=64524 RepID=A0A9P7XKV1_9FUNG|nr:hypothetical protein KI688_004528 [Linnemannia hyalina]